MTNATGSGKSDSTVKTPADEIMNLPEVAERIGLATRGKALSPQRVRMLTDRNMVKDEDGNMVPGPLVLVPLRMGKKVFTFIADGDSEIDWPDGVTDSVQDYIDGVKSGKFKSRVATGRVVLHQSATVDGSAVAVVPEGWTLPEGVSLASALEALATANGIGYKLQERKADTSDGASDDDADSTDADEAAAKLAREQQINAEREQSRASAPTA